MSSTNQDYYKCSEYLYLPKVSSKLSPFCFWTLEAGPEKWQQWALHPAAFYPVWFMGGTVKRAQGRGTSLVVQWLRFWASSARGCGFDLAQGTKIPHAMQHGHKNKNLKKKKRWERAGGRRKSEGRMFILLVPLWQVAMVVCNPLFLGTYNYSLSSPLQAGQGEVKAPYCCQPQGCAIFYCVFLNPTHTFVNILFILFTSIYPIWVCHLFPASILTNRMSSAL